MEYPNPDLTGVPPSSCPIQGPPGRDMGPDLAGVPPGRDMGPVEVLRDGDGVSHVN